MQEVFEELLRVTVALQVFEGVHAYKGWRVDRQSGLMLKCRWRLHREERCWLWTYTYKMPAQRPIFVEYVRHHQNQYNDNE